MNNPLVTIVILNWNGLDDTVECLNSLQKITYPDYKIVVVDNGSEKDITEIIKQKFGETVHVIRCDKNYGFTGGNNIGIRYALDHFVSDYVLLLNNDTVVAPHFLDAMITISESDNRIGITGAKIYDYNSIRIQYVWGDINLWTGQPSYTPKFVAEKIKFSPNEKEQYDITKDAKWISGCCILIKNAVIKEIGLLEESYFAYFEDIEYCTRARESGYRVVYVPSAKIYHKGGRVGDSSSGFVVYLNTRNRFRFMRRHASALQYSCFIVYFFGLYLWFAALYYIMFYRNKRFAGELFRGVHDGFLSK